MDFEIVLRSESEKSSNRRKLCNRRECFFVINAVLLRESLCNKSCFESTKVSFGVQLSLENPARSNCLSIRSNTARSAIST